MAFELNYDEMVFLDAENLAECGIKEAYDSLLPSLKQHVRQPAPITEYIDNDVPSYSVVYGNENLRIYGPDLQEGAGRSWGRATHAFFTIVNALLADTDYRFYAINGGNDLGGMLLTPAEAEAARQSLERKTDWPYIPTLEHPWYGQKH